jgi:hypothetical protein
MIAKTKILILPYAGVKDKTLLHLLVDEFSDDRWTHFQSATAFAKRSGNYKELLEAMSSFAARGGRIEITFGADIFGADVAGSEYEAIEMLLKEFQAQQNVKLFLYHDKKRGRTFHPKIYLFSNEANNEALFIMGSSNWSAGGFYDNIEADVIVELDLSAAEQMQCFANLQSFFSNFWQQVETKKKKGQGFARRVTLDNLERFAPLLGKKGSADESASDTHSEKATRKEISTNPALRDAKSLFEGEPTQVSIPFKPYSSRKSRSKSTYAKSSKSAKAANGTAPILPSTSAINSATHGPQRWEKLLTATDAQRQKGNPTGDIRLTASKWEEGGSLIDHTKYFRHDLFGGFTWTQKNKWVEEASIPVDLTILGKHYGVLELTVSHKPKGEAGQRNYTTGIQWGKLSRITKQKNLKGRTLKLFGPPKGATEPFFIEVV